MPIEDDIMHEVRREAGRTEGELVALIFGQDAAYQQRVNSTCRKLVREGRVLRRGKGGATDPFTYHLPLIERGF